LGAPTTKWARSQDWFLRFVADRAKQSIVEVTVPLSELISEPKKVVANMADKGLWIAGNRDSVAKISELLSSIRPENDIVTVSRPGWYEEIFVSPSGEVFGDCDEPHRLSENVRFADPDKAGNLKGWCKATSAALESANGDFLCIGLLSGFVGPLLNLMQESTSVLINFAGTTSRGKTTAQRLGASVWGNPMRGAALSKFNVTPNAIEAIAERANGSLLAIDEGGQSGMTGTQYQTAVFNLAEGSGKHRLTAAATERKVRRWSTCITISEEIGFADKVKRDGRNPAAGAVARIWEVDVDDAEILSDEVVAQIEGVKGSFRPCSARFHSASHRSRLHKGHRSASSARP
jgi:putative DNA primase/helicase